MGLPEEEEVEQPEETTETDAHESEQAAEEQSAEMEGGEAGVTKAIEFTDEQREYAREWMEKAVEMRKARMRKSKRAGRD